MRRNADALFRRAPDQKVDPEKNAVIRLFKRWVPVTSELHGPRFRVNLGGRWHATPLLVALILLEMSDIILIVVGVKMVWLNDAFGGKFPIEWSLSIIGALLLGAILASLLRTPARTAERLVP